jgi:MobA/MobL family.
MVHNYTKKVGIVHTEIMLPDHAPREYFDRATLWNAVEEVEKSRNSQLAREFELALPVELSAEQNLSLVREYVNRNFVAVGMCADVCIHDKSDGNPHAHVMLTMRPIELDGSWGAKSKKEYVLDENGEKILLSSGEYKSRKVNAVDWNEQTKAEEWRSDWADTVNRFLEQNNHSERIDHRSFERQGIDQIPTIHMGTAAFQMERRGIVTERGNTNRKIVSMNQELRQLKARIRKAKTWLYAQPLINPPTMISVMNGIADSRNLDNRWRKLADLKTRASVFMFLQNNGITDMAQLVGKVEQMSDEYYEVSKKIYIVDRRLDTLSQHLEQYGNYKQCRDIYVKYKQLDPKKRDVFHDKHTEEIQLYETAKRYLDGVMNGRKDIPIKAWQAEQVKLTDDRFSLCEDYYRLKDEIRNVEILRKGVDNLMRGSKAPTHTKDMEI